MKCLNLVILAIISMIFISCTHQSGINPSSAESVALSKTAETSLHDSFLSRSGHRGGILTVLDLTTDQRAQIAEILKSQRERFVDVRRSFEHQPSVEALKTKRQEIWQSIQNEILAVLTPEQRTKFEELRIQLERGEVPEELVDKRIEALSAALNLNEEQKSQIRALGFGHPSRSRKVRGENPREFFRQKRELAKEREKQFLSILTPEQQTIFLQMRAQRRAKMEKNGRSRLQRFGRARAQKRLARLTAALNLAETQQQQLKEIFAGVRSSLVNGYRNGRTRNELRQTMRERMSKIDEQIKRILTEEQLEKYQELKATPRQRG